MKGGGVKIVGGFIAPKGCSFDFAQKFHGALEDDHKRYFDYSIDNIHNASNMCIYYYVKKEKILIGPPDFWENFGKLNRIKGLLLFLRDLIKKKI